MYGKVVVLAKNCLNGTFLNKEKKDKSYPYVEDWHDTIYRPLISWSTIKTKKFDSWFSKSLGSSQLENWKNMILTDLQTFGIR